MLKKLIGLISCLYAFTVHASIIEIQAKNDITQLYHKLSEKKNADRDARIDWISRQFLDKPYELGALGEGSLARYDQYPLYRTDAFDCETYVDTVLALALGHNFEEFQSWMLNIRYVGGKRSYIQRNHFTEPEWNHHNQHSGLLNDITENIGKSRTAFAETVIDKKGWYQKLPQTAIRLNKPDPVLAKQRHAELTAKNRLFLSYPVRTAYIPLTVLFDKNKRPNMQIFNRIPQNAVVEIVRPNWNLKETIGTNLNISHMGFAVWKDGILYYRNASQTLKKVADMPMIDYLKEKLESPTIKGIHVQAIVFHH